MSIEAPKCRQCGIRHWGLAHVYPDSPAPKLATKPRIITPSIVEVQTQKEQAFVALVTESTPATSNAINHGGKRDGAGRKPRGERALTNAERQRAYRERAKA